MSAKYLLSYFLRVHTPSPVEHSPTGVCSGIPHILTSMPDYKP